MTKAEQNRRLHFWLNPEWDGRHARTEFVVCCTVCGAWSDGPCPGPDYDAPEMEGVLRRAVTARGMFVIFEWRASYVDGTMIWREEVTVEHRDKMRPYGKSSTLPLAIIAAFGLEGGDDA